MSNEPVHKAKIGSLSLAVWENETVKDGETRVFKTITLERSYKNGDGDWQKTSQLCERDIGPAIALLQNVQQQVLVK